MKILILATACFLASCSSLNNRQFALNDFESFKIGTVGQDEIVKKFGKPEIEKLLEPGNETAWVYYYAGTKSTRMSFIFNNKSNILVSKTWFIWETDKEADVANIKSRYGNTFTARPAKGTNPHFIPSKTILSDSTTGLRAVVNENSKSVESLTWENKKLRSMATVSPSAIQWTP